MYWFTVLAMGMLSVNAGTPPSEGEGGLRLSTFDIDVTPPIGSRLAYGRVLGHWDLGLRAKGVVLMGADDPIVLCAIDWLGIANESYELFRHALADAANTSVGRVALHAVHQHDAPFTDLSAEAILEAHGHDPTRLAEDFAREVVSQLADAVKASMETAEPVTHVGTGEAEVFKVASNRRLLGPDGKVRAMRWTNTADSPELRDAPEGLIDPMVSLVSFWNEDEPLAVLSYYAVHPQSYYWTGTPNPDFPGVARFFRQLAVPQALHVHFNGAGGNLAAGKYNDGSHENRLILAERLADGMDRAWEATERTAIAPEDVEWRVEPTALPLGDHLDTERYKTILSEGEPKDEIESSARKLAWITRHEAGHRVDLSCLHVGSARIVHFPGEAFVEYQLAAKAERPERFVTMAAYGEYGPAYIGTAEAFEQGGYETSDYATNVSPEVEEILMDAIRKLLAP